MNILIAAIGTAGDVLPMAGLGRALASRGHHILFASTPNFRATAEAAGLTFHALEGIPGASGHRDLYHPTRGMQLVADLLLIPAIRPVFDLISTLDPLRWKVIENGYAFGARIAQELCGYSVTTCIISPICLRSLQVMPVNPGISLPAGAPIFMRRAFLRIIAGMWDRRLAPAINAFRREKDLPHIKDAWYGWRLSPERVIGLFPEWFAPRPSDWPPQFLHGGFTVFDGGLGGDVPPVLHGGGPPIVVFTAGSAGDAAADFFRAALKASHGRPWRPVLLTAGFQLETMRRGRKISPGAYIFDYLPLTQLLPLSALVVHHGGLGTLSLAAATATPQLIVPFGHDQFDNAARVERLGIGRSIRKGPGLARRLRGGVEDMLHHDGYAERCRMVAPHARNEEALEHICRQIESDAGRAFRFGFGPDYRQAV